MRVVTLISSALTLAFFASFPAYSQSKCRAIDGDTVRCGNERIRLLQVYAAEKSDAGGAQARANLQWQLDSGQIRIDRKGKDKYGRTLGDIYVNGRKIGQSDVGTKGGRGLGSTATGKSAAPRTKAQTRAPARSPAVAKPHSTAPKSGSSAGSRSYSSGSRSGGSHGSSGGGRR
ncbi:MAG: thermonuclease family protein [Betaproteobacteria bacterium]|nr:thermonuclease family protein [Betaproteobacteria bacterium]